jgi:transcriptional regulator with XRE-family HTH domain
MIAFPKFVRTQRLERGMSQKTLATKVGAKSSTVVSLLETGRAVPSPDVLREIVDFFGGLPEDVETPLAFSKRWSKPDDPWKRFKGKAWLNFTGYRNMGQGSPEDAVVFLDEWQADYERRHPHVRITEVEDDLHKLSWAHIGIPGWHFSGRRSFVPVIDGRRVQSKNERDKLSEDYSAYYAASYGAKLDAEWAAMINKPRTEGLPYPYQGA